MVPIVIFIQASKDGYVALKTLLKHRVLDDVRLQKINKIEDLLQFQLHTSLELSVVTVSFCLNLLMHFIFILHSLKRTYVQQAYFYSLADRDLLSYLGCDH